MKAYKYLTCLALASLSLSACTDLDETVYSEVSSNNYFNTREDVVAMAFRSFEHGYWTIVPRFRMNELSGDQLIIPRRDGSWDDGGVWRQFHYHTWTPDNHPPCARRMGRMFRRYRTGQLCHGPLQRA